MTTATPPVPPHSLESEQSVLGALMLSGSEADSQLDDVYAYLNVDDFYRKDHQELFKVIHALYERGQAIDILTVSEHLKRIKQLKAVGGAAYLGELVSTAPSLANILTYAEIVRDRSVHRQLIAVGNEVAKLGYFPANRNLNDLIDEAEARVFEIAQKQFNKNPFKPLVSLLTEVTMQIDRLKDHQSNIIGFRTGFTRLDTMTTGLQRGDLIIVAGRPSMGKTTFAMNIAQFIAGHHGDHLMDKETVPEVGIFSMEMGAEQLVLRLFSSVGGVKLKNLRTGNLDDSEWGLLLQAGNALRNKKVHIDDQSGLSIHNLRGRARRLKKENPNLSLLVVDYLQLLNIDKKHDNRTAEVTEISRVLKEMARELNIPVIVISQLNRAVDKRTDNRPLMSDLRESGSIEQDADVIMFVHRAEVYHPEDENLKGKAKLIVSKQRNGETGEIKLSFQGEFSRFVNPALESDEADNIFIE